jgi:triacylglycerol lipase
VKYGISISSPHRGSPIAQYVLNLYPGVQSVLEALAEYFGNRLRPGQQRQCRPQAAGP